MSVNFTANTFSLGIAACNFFMATILVLLNNREKIIYSTIFLVALLLEMCYTSACVVVYSFSSSRIYILIEELEFLMLLLLAPTLFFYILSLTRPNFQLKWRLLLHFLPIGVYVLVNFSYWPQYPETLEQYMAHPICQSHIIFRKFVQIQLLIYNISCIWLIQKHNKVIEELMSSVENKNLLWLRDFMLASIVLFMAWIMTDYLPIPQETYGFITLFLSYWIGYKVTQQKEVFTEFSSKIVLETIDGINESPQIRYKNSSLTDNSKRELMQKIEYFMQTQKPYLNNELTLPMLAESLGISTNNLSQVLNESFGENFYKFVNRYRIEESQRLLLDSSFSHYNILGIAFEAGFNSKATFNKTFKEITGVSPSEFIKNHQNKEVLQK